VVLDHPQADWPPGWEPPVVIKPVRQGSSVGLGIVRRREDWQGALAEALRYDGEALVEIWVKGRELTVGILAGEVLPLVEVRPLVGEYDYHNKYTAGATHYDCPAALDVGAAGRVQAVAMEAFRAVGGRDYARVDVMLDEAMQPWVLEVNTLPGMTETSLFPRAAGAAGLDFGTLCETMVQLTLRRSGQA
jgi:D-alanine-D-alanine ligase